tara:strand:- start:146 stop:754 length:609 start_codon:yes stop_codon:yes gene_type:complete
MDILDKIQDKIMDDNVKLKKYFYTKANKHYVIHIYNPSNESIALDSKNKQFYKELINMLFNKDKKGCFNHEQADNSYYYQLDLQGLVNKFISENKYCLIMINKDFKPLSFLSLGDNAIWSVCTNLNYRKKGYMTILINHTLDLLKYKKIKTDVQYDNLLIYIKHVNPIKDKLFEYYKKFGFKYFKKDSEFIIMKLNKVSISL